MNVVPSVRREIGRSGPGPWRRARRVLFYGVVRGLAAGLRALPREVSVAGLRALGEFAWWVLPRERDLARRQLRQAFPEWNATERDRLARRSLRSLGENLVDCLRSETPIRVGEVAERRLEHARAQGRPVLVLMGHLSAFELIGPCLAHRLAPFAALTANPHNHRLDAWLRSEREVRGVTVFDRVRERWAAARWLRRGHTLAVLADHHGAVQNVPVTWFGRLAPTPVGPARLARWADAMILPITLRRHDYDLELYVEEPLVDAASRDEADVLKWCNERLEDWIRRSPQEWTWFHDRYGAPDV